jgi:hypothetical protein
MSRYWRWCAAAAEGVSSPTMPMSSLQSGNANDAKDDLKKELKT